MPIIRADTGIVTQINVFTVPDGGQQALIEHLVGEVTATDNGKGRWKTAEIPAPEPLSSQRPS